jgi:hypothetical protein
MSASEIEEMVYAWLLATYPAGPTWFDEETAPADAPPLEVRMFYAFNAVEYNISNGGWSQFLWNCLDQWRAILDTAQAGYSLIGADAQAEAVNTLRALCECDETECVAAMETEDGSMNSFAEYTKRSYVSDENAWEELFWGDIYEQRNAWVERNESRFRAIVGRLDA